MQKIPPANKRPPPRAKEPQDNSSSLHVKQMIAAAERKQGMSGTKSSQLSQSMLSELDDNVSSELQVGPTFAKKRQTVS